MKVLILNGSPKRDGNTAFALAQMAEVFAENGVETETLQVGSQLIRGCIGCGSCYKTRKCVFDDLVNQVAAKLDSYDGIVVGSPVYYASPNGTLISFLDRLFYSTGHIDKSMKVGASVVCARRGGCTAAMDVLNKYFTISSMPVASSTYWNQIHGGKPGDAEADAEGIRTMRNLAKNMVFLMKSIAMGKEELGLPEPEAKVFTNFIR
ncbi:MAG: flavodoxin family protein [Oscillospiraceae bacterium]|nr:flavodoxin family protein [Oscillospiraceae bacterium]